MKAEEKVSVFKEKLNRITSEIGQLIVGQHEVVRDTVITLLSGGHILLEGVPGLGKTMLVKTLSQVLDISFSRIQFTPDLMPADITGTNMVMEKESGRREFEFQKGPVFAHLVLADEINRATPKTQSALLEAMQEHATTVGGRLYRLPQPFMVLATQNPIEMEGTYPLPEAQLDRFFFKTLVLFPNMQDLGTILDRTTGTETPPVNRVITGSEIMEMKELAREVLMATPIRDYISRLILATHPGTPFQTAAVKKFIRFGASPRAAQALAIGGKVNALMEGRFNVGFEDVARVVPSALRHRLILNFEAQAEGVEPDTIIQEILKEVSREGNGDAQA
jgi:MoxR-like ATPase